MQNPIDFDAENNPICKDLALLKTIQALIEHKGKPLSNRELYEFYQRHYDPYEFEELVKNGL